MKTELDTMLELLDEWRSEKETDRNGMARFADRAIAVLEEEVAWRRQHDVALTRSRPDTTIRA